MFYDYLVVCPTGKILTALVSGLVDRSSAVRKAYAKAIGYLVKVNCSFLVVCFSL